MKKILMFATAVAMLASCSNNFTENDLLCNSGAGQDGAWNGEGLVVEASAEDVTRVNTNVSGNASYLTWEAGDELTLVHGGAKYVYLAQEAGRVSTFVPKDDANAITSVDATLPVAAFYNVGEVDPATLKATFAVAAEQTEGELTNKLPLCGYAATTVVEEGKIVVKMKPLASVVEFELSASSTWNADALSLGVSSRQLNTYASAEGLVVDAATGAIDLSAATLGKTIKVNLAAMHDFATKRNVSVVVPGVSNATASGETTTYTVPVYHGKGCVKLYKNGVENFRRTIWNSYTVDSTVAVDERKHVYQPLKDILDGHKDGISSAEDMKALADEINYSVETYPCGTGFCNEDGVVLLNNNISLAGYNDWLSIGNNYTGSLDGVEIQFAGHFDGQNNTIEGMNSTLTAEDSVKYVGYDGSQKSCVWLSAGLFGCLAGGSVKNVTVKGSIVADHYTETDAGTWAYVGGIVGNHLGGVVDNCTSYVNISVGQNTRGKLRLGGVVGRLGASIADAELTNCKNYGKLNLEFSSSVNQASQIGGVVGAVGDVSASDVFVFENCENHGEIIVKDFYKTSRMGGVVGYSFYSTVEWQKPCTFSGLKNTGNVTISSANTATTAVYLGGVVANLEYHDLENCVNEGKIEFTSLPAGATVAMGGVVGRANCNNTNDDIYITECVNAGEVVLGNVAINKGWIGGVAGCTHAPCFVEGCKNFGNVTVDTEWTAPEKYQAYIGGISGLCGQTNNTFSGRYGISNCDNYGVIEVAGGIVTKEWRFTGGIAGYLSGGTTMTDDSGAYVEGCNNYGTVRTTAGGANIIGGIAGAIYYNAGIYDCSNSGNVVSERAIDKDTNGSVWEAIGGIIGYINSNANEKCSKIDGCTNTGLVACRKPTAADLGLTSANMYVVMGGIMGAGGCANVTVVDCESTGKVLAAKDDLHTWTTNETWDVTGKANYVYRAAFVAHPKAALVCTDNKIGGYIGTIADQNPTASNAEETVDGVTYTYETLAYTDGTLHALVNDSSSDWYWKKWRHGYTATPATSKSTTKFVGL